MVKSTQIPGLVLRTAEKSDVPQILAFIRQLAEYEKLSHQVEATEAILNESLFGAHPGAEVIFAEFENKAVGFALFFYNFSTFLGRSGLYIEDLFVVPDWRSKGIGEALLRYLAGLAVQRGCGRMEWWVLDWNEPAIRFYKKLGAIPMDEWTVFRLEKERMKNLATSFVEE